MNDISQRDFIIGMLCALIGNYTDHFNEKETSLHRLIIQKLDELYLPGMEQKQ